MGITLNLSPPPGKPRNYGEGQDRAYRVLNANWISIALAAGLVVICLWVRLRLTRNIGWDDLIMLISLYFAIAVMVTDAVGM